MVDKYFRPLPRFGLQRLSKVDSLQLYIYNHSIVSLKDKMEVYNYFLMVLNQKDISIYYYMDYKFAHRDKME